MAKTPQPDETDEPGSGLEPAPEPAAGSEPDPAALERLRRKLQQKYHPSRSPRR